MYIWLPRVLQISSWTAEFRLRLQHGTMQYSSITAANTFERNYKNVFLDIDEHHPATLWHRLQVFRLTCLYFLEE